MAFTAYQYTPATGAEHIFNLKTNLVIAGWTVKMSGTGTAGTGSGTYNSTGDSVTTAALMANTNAWFRIQDPATTREYTFQRTTANTTWRIKYSASAKFTGGSPAAGQTPSATDEAVKYGSGTDASPTGTALLGTDGAYRQKMAIGAAGDTYAWWCGAFTSGTGASPQMVAHDPVNAASSTDTDQLVTIFTSSGNFTSSTLGGAANTSVAAWMSNTRTVSGNHVNLYAAYIGTTTGAGWPGSSVSNPFDTTEDILPMPYLRNAASAAPQGYKGWSSIMRWCGTSKAVGSTLQSGAWIVMGTSIAMAWDGSTTAITV